MAWLHKHVQGSKDFHLLMTVLWSLYRNSLMSRHLGTGKETIYTRGRDPYRVDQIQAIDPEVLYHDKIQVTIVEDQCSIYWYGNWSGTGPTSFRTLELDNENLSRRWL